MQRNISRSAIRAAKKNDRKAFFALIEVLMEHRDQNAGASDHY